MEQLHTCTSTQKAVLRMNQVVTVILTEYKVVEKLFECETALKMQQEINPEQKEINVKVKGALHDLKTSNDDSKTALKKQLGVDVESKGG